MARTNQDRSPRSLRRERRLWQDENNNTRALGCIGCPDLELCGGLTVTAGAFDCLGFCKCKDVSICDNVCRRNPCLYVLRLREINGFGFETLPNIPPCAVAKLPIFVPLLHHNSRREKVLNLEAIATSLYELFDRKSGAPKFSSREEFLDKYKISSNPKIIVSGTHEDSPLERWWGLETREIVIKNLKDIGVDLVTVPNFSLFTNVPRWDNLYNMKRILHVWHEFASTGVPAALHVNARTETDWARWTEFITRRNEVTHLAFEFKTGAGWPSRIEWHAQHLCDLALAVGRPLCLVTRGGMRGSQSGPRVLSMLAQAFQSLVFIDSTAFFRTHGRKRATLDAEMNVRWLPNPTKTNEPLDKLLSHNIKTLHRHFERIIGPTNREDDSAIAVSYQFPPIESDRQSRPKNHPNRRIAKVLQKSDSGSDHLSPTRDRRFGIGENR